MKKRLTLLLIVGFLSSAMVCLAVEAKEKKAPKEKGPPVTSEQPTGEVQAYLGIGIEPVHPALLSHLLDLIGEGGGVSVGQVAEGSPAAKAGLKMYDVLTSYDGQKITSPEEFVKLVQADKPGREVKLNLIRAGKAEEVKVTLGEHQVAATPEAHRAFRVPLKRLTPEEREARWSSFDSMTLTRVDKDRFKAEVKYRDDQGKVDSRTFEGSRDEIRKAIDGEKDLPANERAHLLRALDMPGHPVEFDFPGFRVTPEGGVMWDFE
jgi:membrane-associated protease RseP (regulator of RpoE activity)